MLLFQEKPYKDETICSLLYRTANLNLMENLDWIFDNFQSYSGFKFNKNNINWIKDDELLTLAAFLNIAKDTLNEKSFSTILSSLNLSFNILSTNQWFHFLNSKFCSHCLKEYSYQKIEWMNSFSITCLKHNCFLLDQCQFCKRQISSKNIVLDKCQCGAKLTDHAMITVVDQNLLLFQKIINKIIYFKNVSLKNDIIINSKTFMETMLFFCTWSSQLLSEPILSIDDYKLTFSNNTLAGTRLKNTLKIEQSICLIKHAFDIINNWPLSFYEFIDEIYKQSQPKFFSFIKNIVPNLKHTNLNYVSRFLTEYYKTKLNLPLKDIYYRLDEVYTSEDNMSKNLLYSNFVPYKEYRDKGISIKLIADFDLKMKRKELDKCISKEELRSRWRTSPKATLSILKNGIIKNANSYEMGSVNNWLIPIKSIVKIERTLIENSNLFQEEAILLNNAIQWVGIEKAPYLVEGLLNNKISYTYLPNQEFSSISISKKECYSFIENIIYNQGFKDKCIKIRDLVFLLGVKKSDIHYWLDTGRFHSQGNTIHDYSVIPIEDCLYFKSRYLTTFQASIIYNTTIPKLLKKVKSGKIKTISGPKLNDGNRVLFNKNDQIHI